MNTKMRLEALATAYREGVEPPEWAKLGASQPLNNLNLNNKLNLKPTGVSSSLSRCQNLNNLKALPEKKRSGVPRIQLWTDATLRRALEWGFDEAMLQVCIREYGEYTVKGEINRIYQIPDGYFKPKYGPIPGQRGKLFNVEMQKRRRINAEKEAL